MVEYFEICASIEGVEGRKFAASKMFMEMIRRYIFTPLVGLRYNTEFDEANDITYLISNVYSYVSSERFENPRSFRLAEVEHNY